jgi:hypothetical protein
LQVSNPFAIDWQLLHDMPAAHKLVASGALLCLFREIFVKSATVRAAVRRAPFGVCPSVPLFGVCPSVPLFGVCPSVPLFVCVHLCRCLVCVHLCRVVR